jgi:branched-chain amino acid transport system ATP-binding protein
VSAEGLVLDSARAGYKGTDVLQDVDLVVSRASCVGVLGPNGAGKSTLLKLVSGQIGVRGGSRVVDGVDTGGWRAHRIARAGVRWVGEPRPIFPALTVEENLAIGGITRRDAIDAQSERVYSLLPALRDKRTARAASLSGGQQQMLAIGQALMSEPRYLCLDEPARGLAPPNVQSLANLISELAATGVGVLWAEQFPEVAISHCTHLIVLSGGRVLASGTAESVSQEEIRVAYLGTQNNEQ